MFKFHEINRRLGNKMFSLIAKHWQKHILEKFGFGVPFIKVHLLILLETYWLYLSYILFNDKLFKQNRSVYAGPILKAGVKTALEGA